MKVGDGFETTTEGLRYPELGVPHLFSNRVVSRSLTRESAVVPDVVTLWPEQPHGAEVARIETLPESSCTIPGCDGIFIPSSAWQRPVAIAIRSADCLPILIAGPLGILGIHAGWRSLAAGILRKVVTTLPGGGSWRVAIGPCAGPKRYEVGPEVVAALGGDGVTTASSAPGRYLLDLPATAARQLSLTAPWCQTCTIENEQWFSFRREGKTGGNISWIGWGF